MDLGTHSLLPGERLLWSGRPQRFPLRLMDVYLLGFGLLWLTLNGTFLAAALNGGGPPLPIPILFLAFGLVMTWGRVLMGQLALRSTTYLLTDRRMVVVSTRPRYSEHSEYLTRLAPPVVKPASDGSGTIGFGAMDFMTQMASMSGMKRNPFGGSTLIELRAIPDVVLVRDQIANAQARAAQGAS